MQDQVNVVYTQEALEGFRTIKDQSEDKSQESEESSKKSKRVKLSRGARKAAQIYDKYSKATVKDLKSQLKEAGYDKPLSRLSKSYLIAILEETTREKKPRGRNVKKATREIGSEEDSQ